MCSSAGVHPSRNFINTPELDPSHPYYKALYLDIFDPNAPFEADLSGLTLEQIAQLEAPQEMRSQDPITCEYALAMLNQGFPEARARKTEDCGRYGHAAFCANRHFDHLEIGYCGEPWMPCCRDRYAKTRTEPWQKIIDHISQIHSQRGGKSIFVEIRMDSAKDADFALEQFGAITSKVESLRKETVPWEHHDHQISPCPTWRRMCGIIDGTLVLRILIDDNDGARMALVPAKRWKELWPEAKVAIHVDTSANFAKWFARLVQPLKIDSPEECAWHARAFYRKKLVRHDNYSCLCYSIHNETEHLEYTTEGSGGGGGGAGEQTVDNNTVYSEPVDNTQDKSKTPHKCRYCGLPVDQKSSHLPVHSPEMRRVLEELHSHDGSPPLPPEPKK
jgi:hypothetical protein